MLTLLWLTLIRPCFLVGPQPRGGWNLPTGLFELLRPNFHPNQSKHGLKWNLAPSYTYKNFEQHPMNISFSVRPSQSDLVWRSNFRDFDLTCRFLKDDNFPPTWIICISNESWNHSKFIFATKKCYFVWNCLKKIGFQKKIFFNFWRKKNFDHEFF